MILILELHSFPSLLFGRILDSKDLYIILLPSFKKEIYRDLVTKPEYLTKVSESVFEILSEGGQCNSQ